MTAPGVDFLSDLSVAFNNTTAAVSRTVTVGSTTSTLDLAAGPYFRLDGSGVSLRIQGQTLEADLALEQVRAADGTASTVLGLSRVSLAMGSGSYGVTLANGSGMLLVTSAGVAGRLTGQLSVACPPTCP